MYSGRPRYNVVEGLDVKCAARHCKKGRGSVLLFTRSVNSTVHLAVKNPHCPPLPNSIFWGPTSKDLHASRCPVILSVNPQSIRTDKDFAHTHLMPDPLEANLSHFGITACCPLAQTLHKARCTPVKYQHRVTAERIHPSSPLPSLSPAVLVINAQMWLTRRRARTPDLTAGG